MALTSLSFFPALGQKTSVLVPVNNGGVVHLRFTVTVDAEEYRELERQNAQLQLWSDIPTPGAGRPAGQWGDFGFRREDERVPTGTGEGSEGVVHFNAKSSGITTAGGTSSNKTVILLLNTTIQLSGASTLDVAGTWQYSFTYRLASSSGEVTWLGGYGQDGVLVLSSNPRLAAQSDGTLLQVSGSWSALDGADDSETPRTFARDIGRGEQYNGLEVLRLGKASTYSLLGISKNGSLNSARNIEDVAILLAIPHPAPEILVPPTLLLAASTDAHLSLTADNIVSTSGSGTIRLAFIDTRCPNTSLNRAIQDAIAWGSSSARILSPDNDRVAPLILASGESTIPAQVAIIPCSGVPEDVAIPFETLTSLLPQDTQQFAITSVEARAAGIYSAASGIHTVMVSTGPESAELVLSPSYDLLGPTPHDQSLLVSFLTAHSLAFSAPTDDGADVLPTPPPSPPQRAVSTSDPVDPLTPSTSGSTQFSDLTTSISNSSDVSCTTASSRSTIPPSSSNRNSERALIPQLGMRRNRGMVIACMGLFVHMAKVFIGSVFCRVFYLLFGSGAGARVGKSQKKGNGRSKPTGKVDERTALLPKAPSQVTPRTEKEESVVSEPPTAEERIVDNIATVTSTQGVKATRCKHEYIFDMPAGRATLLVKDNTRAPQLWMEAFISVDGKTVIPDVEATLDDSAGAGDLKVMTFGLEKSARVKMYMNC